MRNNREVGRGLSGHIACGDSPMTGLGLSDSEEFCPCQELFGSAWPETGQAVESLLECLLLCEPCLREELVGKADDLLLVCLGNEVPMRKRQALFLDVEACESGSCMPFTYPGVTGVAFGTEDVGSDDAMADVWLGAETLNAGRIAAEYPDVVEHGCFFDELKVEIPFRMASGD